MLGASERGAGSLTGGESTRSGVEDAETKLSLEESDPALEGLAFPVSTGDDGFDEFCPSVPVLASRERLRGPSLFTSSVNFVGASMLLPGDLSRESMLLLGDLAGDPIRFLGILSEDPVFVLSKLSGGSMLLLGTSGRAFTDAAGSLAGGAGGRWPHDCLRPWCGSVTTTCALAATSPELFLGLGGGGLAFPSTGWS